MLLSVLTKEQIEQGEYCFKMRDKDYLVCDSIDEYIDRLYANTTCDNYGQLPEQCKEVFVYKKERMQIPHGYLMQWVEDYLSDNYDYDSYELGSVQDYIGDEIFKQFTDTINKQIPWYIVGDITGVIDLSKEMDDFLKQNK